MKRIILSLSILGIFVDSCAMAVPGRPIFYDREREAPAPTATQPAPQPAAKVEQSTQTVETAQVTPALALQAVKLSKFQKVKNFFWEKPAMALLGSIGIAVGGYVITEIGARAYEARVGNFERRVVRNETIPNLIMIPFLGGAIVGAIGGVIAIGCAIKKALTPTTGSNVSK